MTYITHLPIFIHSKANSKRIGLDIVDGDRTIIQRAVRRDGIANYQLTTTQTILAAFSYIDSMGKDIVFYDIGCNSGYYTLLCKSYWQNSLVLGFEACKTVCDVASEIADLNDLSIDYHNFAVSSEGGEAELYLSDKSDASNSLTKGFRKSRGIEMVNKITLDDFVKCDKRTPPNIIKIDVELHEPQVLAGAENIIMDNRPVIIAEALKRDDVMEFYIDWSSRHGYTPALVTDNGLKPITENFIDDREATSDYIKAENDIMLMPHSTLAFEMLDYIKQWRLSLLESYRLWAIHRICKLTNK